MRIHVLGPPRDNDDLFASDPRKGETYDPQLAVLGHARGLHATAEFFEAASTRAAGKRKPGSNKEVQYPFAEPHKKPRGRTWRSRTLKTMLAR